MNFLGGTEYVNSNELFNFGADLDHYPDPVIVFSRRIYTTEE